MIKWQKASEHVMTAIVDMPCKDQKLRTIALRIDRRTQPYRVDMRDLGPWEAIDRGDGVHSISEAEALAASFVRAAIAQSTYRPKGY